MLALVNAKLAGGLSRTGRNGAAPVGRGCRVARAALAGQLVGLPGPSADGPRAIWGDRRRRSRHRHIREIECCRAEVDLAVEGRGRLDYGRAAIDAAWPGER